MRSMLASLQRQDNERRRHLDEHDEDVRNGHRHFGVGSIEVAEHRGAYERDARCRCRQRSERAQAQRTVKHEIGKDEYRHIRADEGNAQYDRQRQVGKEIRPPRTHHADEQGQWQCVADHHLVEGRHLLLLEVVVPGREIAEHNGDDGGKQRP
ncbi:MAG: hypothetical protein R3D30_03880 [Hyphomicrobiales bacterium]